VLLALYCDLTYILSFSRRGLFDIDHSVSLIIAESINNASSSLSKEETEEVGYLEVE
jgi:hypothetical protein